MIEILITTSSPHADGISEALLTLGAAAVTLKDAGDQPIYEPNPDQPIAWDDMLISVLFEKHVSFAPINGCLEQLQSQGCLQHFVIQELVEKDWVRITQEQEVPLQFGQRLWICPAHQALPDTQAVNVIFNPGLAFGTGTHPTTALCLEWLEANIQGGETLLDYGCGSGILAVAALKLGVKYAIGVDHDTQALDASRMNANLNGFSSTVLKVCLPDELAIEEPVDILVANILAQPLIELAPHFARCLKPQGKIILSGILNNQYEEVKRAYQKWFSMDSLVIKNEWVRLDGARHV